MARVELFDDRFVIHNEGLRRLLTIVGSVTVRYEAGVYQVESGSTIVMWSSWVS